MNKKLDNYLCKKYPKIFAERNLSPAESCMGRGFECGNGWLFLIDALCYDIQSYIDGYNNCLSKGAEPIPQFVALQVKEKFGGLRVYHRGGDEYCQGLVDMAATLSYYICEVCGTGGPVLVGQTKGWIQSICEKCAERNKRPKVYFNTKLRNLMLKVVEENKSHA